MLFVITDGVGVEFARCTNALFGMTRVNAPSSGT
jgi:hypothetical protein